MRIPSVGRPTVRNTLSTLALLAGAAATARAGWLVAQSVQLSRASRPYSINPEPPTVSLLIVGDSTGVGTGASAPETSLAGLLAQAHSGLRIVNLSRDGAKFGSIAFQLAGTERFDLILIVGGGNDVIRLTAESRLRDNLDRAVSRACARSDHVIVMPAGNIGNAPFFFAPFSWWMARRARTLHEAAAEISQAHGATFVDLYREHDTDPFGLEPQRMNARDGLHPSDAGYAFWCAELERQAQISQVINAAKKRSAALEAASSGSTTAAI